MLRETTHTKANQAIVSLVEELLAEERQQLAQERRSLHREGFVRPVSISIREGMDQDPGQLIVGFSKNISDLGIGLVTKKELVEQTVAAIQIHRFQKDPIVMLSECRWCKDFGHGWFISGWHFLSVTRG